MEFNENQTQTLQTAEPAVSVAKPELINGSHALIQSLIKEGVETIFGYPGGAIMPVYDAIYDYLCDVGAGLGRGFSAAPVDSG